MQVKLGGNCTNVITNTVGNSSPATLQFVFPVQWCTGKKKKKSSSTCTGLLRVLQQRTSQGRKKQSFIHSSSVSL